MAYFVQSLAMSLSREKLLRLTQYWARLCAWFLSRSNSLPGTIATWKLLMKQAALIRKLSRLGNNVEYFRAAFQTFAAKDQDSVIRYTSMGRQLGFAGYLTCDAATSLDILGIRKLKAAKRVQMEASRFWSAALLCSVIAQVYNLSSLRQQAQSDKEDNASQRKHIATEQMIYQLQLCSDLCDLTISTSSFNLVPVSDGIIGVCGVLSTLIGIYSPRRS
ncbi:peroxisomal biogenesis factor 11 [Ilyonectria sp. MPI-CAGE-AT-0026]|nr:peroxisomal biogenesis factor 11 [Ilyonectria sp. MPI-CAGE-AT-0026]